MTTSERIAIAWTPLFLRLALAATFIWAGSIKVFFQMDVSGEKAAALTAMGLTLPTAAPVSPPAQPSPASPDVPVPPPGSGAGGLDKPLPVPDSAPAPKADKPASKTKPPAIKPGGAGGPAARTIPMVEVEAATDIATPAAARTVRTVAMRQDAAGGSVAPTVKVRRLYGLALMLQGAAKVPTDAGKKQFALWPGTLATGKRPLVAAWAVALTELIAGSLVLIGLFTRLSALSLGACMTGALWLTEIGPAIQSGSAALGFLPNYDVADTKLWSTPLWQFGLLMSALALACAGAGVASIDRTLGGRPAKGGGAGGGGGPPKA
ncbi:MAG: DoxX family membrane protein [Phycisphaerales bacterium]